MVCYFKPRLLIFKPFCIGLGDGRNSGSVIVSSNTANIKFENAFPKFMVMEHDYMSATLFVPFPHFRKMGAPLSEPFPNWALLGLPLLLRPQVLRPLPSPSWPISSSGVGGGWWAFVAMLSRQAEEKSLSSWCKSLTDH